MNVAQTTDLCVPSVLFSCDVTPSQTKDCWMIVLSLCQDERVKNRPVNFEQQMASGTQCIVCAFNRRCSSVFVIGHDWIERSTTCPLLVRQTHAVGMRFMQTRKRNPHQRCSCRMFFQLSIFTGIISRVD